MPKYMLILREADFDMSVFASPEKAQALLGEYIAWSQKLGATGRLHKGLKLTDQGGRCVTRPKGKLIIKDGPYGETKDLVGGFYLISADSYDHAVKTVENHPQIVHGGHIEIREVDFMGKPEEI